MSTATARDKARRVARGLLEGLRAEAEAAPSTAEPEPEPPRVRRPRLRIPIDYHRARRFLRWYDGLLRVHDTAAEALADEHLGPREAHEPVEAEADAALEQLVTDAHRILLSHPVAARQAFAALVAEGRAHAQTPEGRALHQRLLGSVRVQQASRLFRSLSMGMLGGDEAQTRLPSTYLDNLMRIVDTAAVERLVGRLLQRLRG